MTRQRRQFTHEFKIEAVRRVLEDGQSISQVAADLKLNTNLVGRWKREFVDEKIIKLKRERNRLESELETLDRFPQREHKKIPGTRIARYREIFFSNGSGGPI